MSTPTLQDLTNEALKGLQIELLAIKPVKGASWNVGELAFAKARFTNKTGYTLKNVVVETVIFSGWGATTPKASYQPCYNWDGNGGIIYEMEPGAVEEEYIALLKAEKAGQFALIVNASADVVPAGDAPSASKNYTVQPPA